MAPELTLYAQAEPAVLQPGSAAQEAYKQALVADLALSLGLNASLIEITAISSAMRRHLRLSPSPLVAGANGGATSRAAAGRRGRSRSSSRSSSARTSPTSSRASARSWRTPPRRCAPPTPPAP
jgi:hypothetical protein